MLFFLAYIYAVILVDNIKPTDTNSRVFYHENPNVVACADTGTQAGDYMTRIVSFESWGGPIPKDLEQIPDITISGYVWNVNGVFVRYQKTGSEIILKTYLPHLAAQTITIEDRLNYFWNLYMQQFNPVQAVRTKPPVTAEELMHGRALVFPFPDGKRSVEIPRFEKERRIGNAGKALGVRADVLAIHLKDTHISTTVPGAKLPASWETERTGEISITSEKTHEAGFRLLQEHKTVGLINCANASNLGGGVRNGLTAQEEDLMRAFPELWISYLRYMEENSEKRYIAPTEILVTKFPKENGELVALAAAAPSFFCGFDKNTDAVFHKADAQRYLGGVVGVYKESNDKVRITKDGYVELMSETIRNLLRAARNSGVEVLVLGALGCGVYNNPPKVVAKIFRDILNENDEEAGFLWKNHFKRIVFAIWAPPTSYNANLKHFMDVFSQV